MELFNEARLKFEKPDWSYDPEFGVIDTVLEAHPEMVTMFKEEVMGPDKDNNKGRKDSPSLEQVVRGALFKELRGLDYRGLEHAQKDSRICATFLKLDQRERPFSFQAMADHISRITPESLHDLLLRLNQVAIDEGIEDLKAVRMDSTVVKSDIHYPTNNSLVQDCLKKSHRFLEELSEEYGGLTFRDYREGGKSFYFKINNTKSKDKRAELFRRQLITFTKAINELDKVVRTAKKKALAAREGRF